MDKRNDGERIDENTEALLEQIARRELKLPSLKPHNSSHDMVEVNVWAVHRALHAAYFAGRSYANTNFG